MREYGKVKTEFWQDDRVKQMGDDGKTLALYLLTCPHGNGVGCFMLPAGYAQEDLGWDHERVRRTLSELLSLGFIQRDGNGLTRLVNWWKHNSVENPNVGKALAKAIDALPNKRGQIFQDLIDSLEPFAERFPERFLERYREQRAYPEPEPEPELELQPFRAASVDAPPASAEPPPPTARRTRCGIEDLEAADFAALAATLPKRVNVGWELDKFRDWSRGKGRAHRDAAAAFRNWLRKAAEGPADRAQPPPAGARPPAISEAQWDRWCAEYARCDQWQPGVGRPPDHPETRCPAAVWARHDPRRQPAPAGGGQAGGTA